MGNPIRMKSPSDIAFGPDGNVYVSSKYAILRYSWGYPYALELIDALEISYHGHIFEDIAFGPDGNLYAAVYDTSHNCGILRINIKTGVLIDSVSIGGFGVSANIRDMVFGPNGNLFVANGDAGNVIKVKWASEGYITLPGGQKVLVSTTTQSSEFVSAGSGGLSGPTEIGFGQDGNLYVCSFNGNPLLRYNGTTGAFIDVFLHDYDGNELERPTSLCFTPGYNITVNKNGQGTKWEPGENTASAFDPNLPPRTPGAATWSIMPAGIGRSSDVDTENHSAGAYSTPFAGMTGLPDVNGVPYEIWAVEEALNRDYYASN